MLKTVTNLERKVAADCISSTKLKQTSAEINLLQYLNYYLFQQNLGLNQVLYMASSCLKHKRNVHQRDKPLENSLLLLIPSSFV